MCCHCRQCCCCVADVAVVADVAASWPGQVFAKCFDYMRGSSQLQGRNGFCTLTCSRNLDSCDAYKINKPTLIFICCCQEVDMTLPLPSGLDTYLHTATKWQRQNVDKCQSGKRFVAALRWHLSLTIGLSLPRVVFKICMWSHLTLRYQRFRIHFAVARQ